MLKLMLRTMRVFENIVCFAALALIAATTSSCGDNGTDSAAGGNDGKIDYAPEVNVVDVIELKRSDFHLQLVSNGKVSASSRMVMKFRSSAAPTKVYVSNGQHVRAGDVLAEQDARDAELSVESAEIALDKAEIELYDVLIGLGYPSGDTLSVPADILKIAKLRSGYSTSLNALKRARYDRDCAVLRAPFSGYVADLSPDLYSSEKSSGAFCTVIDDRSFIVSFSVMESDYSFLEKGLPVVVSPFADPSVRCRGKITDINPSVDSKGQIVVCASVPRHKSLIDGMNVKVTVEKNVPGQLVVPRSAVVIRDNLDVLFTYTPDGKAHWVYVNIMAANRDSFVVTANEDRGAKLSEGEIVIISSNLNLAEGSSVKLKSSAELTHSAKSDRPAEPNPSVRLKE